MKTSRAGLVRAVIIWIMLAASPAVLTAVSVAPAVAQAANYSNIQVRGNFRIETATIVNFMGLDLGSPLTGGQINAAYQRLLATGLFEEVAITPSGGTLVVTVQEYPTINRINFERNKKLKDEKLAELITSQPRHTYSPAQAEADAALIVEAYRQAGRHSAEVKPKIIRRADNRVDLVFEIFEGDVVEIERLSFVGNRHFSDRRLRRVLGTKQAGILRGLIRSDTFVADRIAFDKQVLADFYLSRGFIDFHILSVATETVRERNGFFLTFTVQEGQSFKFGKISTTSDVAEVDADEFSRIVRLKSGATYSPALIESTIERLENFATSKGLNFIRANPRVTRNDSDLTLDIEFVLERGPRVYVERIDIEGNTTTLDRVIRREFKTVEGDPFNPREIRAASNRIRALGFFSSVEVTPREGSSPDRVIVDVNVEDQPTGSLAFGVTYGAGSGVGGILSLSESNFLGRGQFFRLELGTSSENQNTGITFAEPRFLGRNLRLELDLFQRTTDQAGAFYDTLARGFQPKLTFPVSQFGKMDVYYRFGSDTLNNITGTASGAITAGTRTNSTIGLGYSYDSRGVGLNPAAGTNFRITQEIAGLGGDSRFSKTSFLAGGQTSVMNEEVTLTAEFEGGYLKDFTGASWTTDRFYMGSSVMRGFAKNGIGPRDVGVANMDALGGNMFAVARFEAQFPLGLPEEYGITGGAFLDVGSLWSLDAATVAAGTTIDPSMHIRAVVGFSVFWQTAIGPLRFNFTQAIAKQSYDIPETFSLTIGKKF